MTDQTKPDSTLPRGPALTLAKALMRQANEEPVKSLKKMKHESAKKLREMAIKK